MTTYEDVKEARERALKARIAARRAEADKKAKEAAQKRAEREALAKSRWPVTRQLRARLLKGAMIVTVMNINQALLAQDAGATAIWAVEKPTGLVVRMPTPVEIKKYMNEVLIPVIAGVRIGHLLEAKVMESIGVNVVDESNIISTETGILNFSKRELGIPAICAVASLGDCLLRIQEGALILRIAGIRDGKNVQMALRTLFSIQQVISEFRTKPEVYKKYLEDEAYYKPLVEDIYRNGRLPVLLFGSGGVHAPSDAAIMMKHGCDGIIIDNNVFTGPDPYAHIQSIIQASKDFDNVAKICELSNQMI
ncbi:hypothetical protein GGI20_006013 [Coemansia sp. BCRC 34301]|nr:hypothetical protein GGI20_006013 [Coemansia sp. BCRC 34301]